MRQHAGVFGSLLVVAAILTGLALGVLGLVDRASAAGVRAELASRTGDDGVLRLTMRLTDDPDAADSAVRASIATAFRDGDRAVPLLVRHTARTEVSGDRLDTWTITPDVPRLEPRDLAPIVTGWPLLPEELEGHALGEVVDQNGHLALTAAELDRQVRALDAVGPASLLLVAMIALVTFVELGRLLAEVRTRELGLLWARGATPAEVAATTAAETAIAAGAGTLLGVAGAAALVASGDADGFARLGAVWVWMPLTIAITAVLAVSAHALLGTRRASRIDDPARTGRGQRVAGAGVVVLVVLAAALATWQLRLYGSPVTPDAAGGSSVDAIAVSAPALLVAALVLAGLLLFARLARVAERAAVRDRRAAPALVARSLARRLALAATPIALVALAVSQLLVSAGYAGSWERSHTQSHALRSGTELRIDPGPRGLDGTALDGVVGTPGVERVAPVAGDLVRLGDDEIELVGISADALRDLGLDGGGTIDPAGLADDIRVSPAGARLSAGAETISLELGAPAGVTLQDVRIWLQTDDGLLRTVAAVPARDGYLATLPPAPGDASWRLVGIDLTLPYGGGDTLSAPVELDGLLADGSRIELGTGWHGVDLLTGDRLDPSGSNGAEVPWGASARLLAPSSARAVPIVLARTVAESMVVTTGSRFAIPLDRGSLTVEVARVVDGIPGSDRTAALLLDGPALQLATLGADSDPSDPELVWIGADDRATTADALRATLAGSSRVVLASEDAVGAMLATSSLVLWVTAAGSALLALAALGAVVGAQLRSRGDETAVLRALGFAARQQAAARRRELLAVIGYGALVGLVAGAVVVIVVITVFVRAAVPDAYPGIPTDVAVDARAGAIAFAALGVCLAAFVAGYGSLVARQARHARVPEDAR